MTVELERMIYEIDGLIDIVKKDWESPAPSQSQIMWRMEQISITANEAANLAEKIDTGNL